MGSAVDRLREFTAPTGAEELLDVAYPKPRFGVTPKQGVLLGAGLIAVFVGYLLFAPPASVTPPAEEVFSQAVAATTAETEATEVVVSVVGEVEHPGLVTLAPDSRIADALTQAVVKPEGNIVAVNQAQKATDGMQIVVPPVGAPVPAAGVVGGGPDIGGGLISLNTASAAQLQELPGVGEKTAQAIVEFRETQGSFHSVEQLQEVKGIGAAKFEQLKDLVTL